MGVSSRCTAAIVSLLAFIVSGCSAGSGSSPHGVYVAGVISDSAIQQIADEQGLSAEQIKTLKYRANVYASGKIGAQLQRPSIKFSLARDGSLRHINNTDNPAGVFKSAGADIQVTLYRYGKPPGERDEGVTLKLRPNGALASDQEEYGWLEFSHWEPQLDYSSDSLVEQLPDGMQPDGQLSAFFTAIKNAEDTGVFQDAPATEADVLLLKHDFESLVLSR